MEHLGLFMTEAIEWAPGSYWLLLPSFCLTERWVADSLFYLSWELAFLPWDSCDLLCLSLESILVTWIDDFREAER